MMGVSDNDLTNYSDLNIQRIFI